MRPSEEIPVKKLAVLLAVKDGGEKLRRTLDSLHEQTLDHALYNVCVYDDGSTDQTPRILEQYERAGKCVVVGRNPTALGLTKTLNLLIRATRSEFVARADCGDRCAPERFEHQLRYFETHPRVEAVCTSVRVFVPPDRFVGPLFVPLATEVTARMLRVKNPVSHGSVMLRRSALEAVGGYDESCRFAQDFDLWVRLLTAGHTMHWLKEPLYLVEVEQGGISGNNADKQAETVDRIREKYFGEGKSTGRRMTPSRMLAMARLREVAVLGRAFRLAEALAYELRCRLKR